jgi:hypothetical protein
LERVTENGDVFQWALSGELMQAINGEDLGNRGGRIMKGDNFAVEGVKWEDMWDE